MVLNMALGLTAGRSFKVPDEGPLGLTRFWERSVHSAVLVQKIAAALPDERRPSAGCSYLCGLLHDFGVLLLGYLFPPEFRLLNRFAAAHPGCSLSELECRLLGMGEAREVLAMGHAGMGGWLMKAWNMPEVMQVALREHHNPDYRGEHEVLVHLVQVVDFLLMCPGEMPAAGEIPAASLEVLEVASQNVVEIAAAVYEAKDDFSALASMLSGAS